MKSSIPIHPFSGERKGGIPVRYEPLHVRNEYDFAKPHRHEYFELFFFTGGGGSHAIDFGEYGVEDNSVHLVYPGQVHLLRREPSSHGAVLHFTRQLFMEMQGVGVLMGYTVFTARNSLGQQAELNALLQQVQHEYDRETPDSEILKTYIQLLLLKCLRFAVDNGVAPRPVANDYFVDFKLRVEESFRKHASASSYAAQMGITERRLNEACRIATGTGANGYIKERLLLEAKRLLYNTKFSVKEISHRLGFEDPSYFNRFFRKNVGMTAGEFRSRSQKGS